MEAYVPLLFAAVVGFGHAFEADHLVAVGNIVTKRNKIWLAIKDGIFWGLGHSSTIILIGILMIGVNVSLLDDHFRYFEAAVGAMLIILGVYRMCRYHHRARRPQADVDLSNNHHLAYGVGIVHGLAGSGAMILLVMTDIPGKLNGILYLVIFGIGSIIGMLVAAGIFSMPFSRKMNMHGGLRLGLVVLSSVLCIGYGAYVLAGNL